MLCMSWTKQRSKAYTAAIFAASKEYETGGAEVARQLITKHAEKQGVNPERCVRLVFSRGAGMPPNFSDIWARELTL